MFKFDVQEKKSEVWGKSLTSYETQVRKHWWAAFLLGIGASIVYMIVSLAIILESVMDYKACLILFFVALAAFALKWCLYHFSFQKRGTTLIGFFVGLYLLVGGVWILKASIYSSESTVSYGVLNFILGVLNLYTLFNDARLYMVNKWRQFNLS